MAKELYIDAELKPITESLDTLWLNGQHRDIATVIQYAAQRLSDLYEDDTPRGSTNPLAAYIANEIEQHARVIADTDIGD